MQRMQRWLAATIVVVAALHAGQAQAQMGPRPANVEAPAAVPPADEYATVIDEAINEFGLGNFEEALALFERAYKIRPTARVQRGIGKVLFELKQYVKADQALEAALGNQDEALTGALRQEVEDLRLRASRFIGRLSVTVKPETAEILIDGKPREEAGGLIHLDVGSHVVEASAEGFQPTRRTVEIVGGEAKALDLSLKRLGGKAPRRTLYYTAIGLDVTFALATVGSIAWFINRNGALSRCQDAVDDGATCANGDTLSDQRNLSLVSVVGSSIGLVGSGILTYLAVRKIRRESRVQAACLPQQSGAYCMASASW